MCSCIITVLAVTEHCVSYCHLFYLYFAKSCISLVFFFLCFLKLKGSSPVISILFFLYYICVQIKKIQFILCVFWQRNKQKKKLLQLNVWISRFFYVFWPIRSSYWKIIGLQFHFLDLSLCVCVYNLFSLVFTAWRTMTLNGRKGVKGGFDDKNEWQMERGWRNEGDGNKKSMAWKYRQTSQPDWGWKVAIGGNRRVKETDRWRTGSRTALSLCLLRLFSPSINFLL